MEASPWLTQNGCCSRIDCEKGQICGWPSVKTGYERLRSRWYVVDLLGGGSSP